MVKIIAGIDLLPAVGEMGVFAVLLRAAAGKVLGHASHALGSQFLALEAADVGFDHSPSQLGVLAKGAVDACPARFRRQVCHGMQRHPDAHCQVFLPGDIPELLHDLFIADRCQPDGLGPLRKGP